MLRRRSTGFTMSIESAFSKHSFLQTKMILMREQGYTYKLGFKLADNKGSGFCISKMRRKHTVLFQLLDPLAMFSNASADVFVRLQAQSTHFLKHGGGYGEKNNIFEAFFFWFSRSLLAFFAASASPSESAFLLVERPFASCWKELYGCLCLEIQIQKFQVGPSPLLCL